MRAIITVFDKRTFNGLNTRAKEVNTINEAILFCKSVKNRVLNEFTLVNKNVCERIKF